VSQSAKIIILDSGATAADGLSPDALAAANINPHTFLATDYLNHYNEMIMMIELLPDMPDCLEDIEQWAPKSYCDHFRDSTFHAKELAITAYGRAARHVRAHFEYVAKRLDARIERFTRQARRFHDDGNMDAFRLLCDEAAMRFSPLLDELSAIIHGTLDSSAHHDGILDHDHAQAEIDALFD